MLLKKDVNTLSAPILHPLNTQNKNNSNPHSNEKRKPILKKNAITQNTDEYYIRHDKQNLPRHSKTNMSQLEEAMNGISSEHMRKIQKKKKSIFLQLEQNKHSNETMPRDTDKKISFVSLFKSENDELQVRQSKRSYNQSKIDIFFSNSNFSDSFWNNQTQHQIDFDLPQKSFKNLKSSQVVQPQLKEPTSIRLQFKKPKLYQAKKSDRIIQESDTKRQQRVEQAKDSNKNDESTPLSTASSNLFKKRSYYAEDSQQNGGKGTCFTIKQTPPPTQQLLGYRQQKTLKQNLQSSKSTMRLNPTNYSSLHRKRIEESSKQPKQTLKESISSENLSLLVTLNPVSSQVLPQSICLSHSSLQREFNAKFFEIINSYRFLNRLCYKVKKYLKLNTNQKSYDELVAQMTKVKCFTLLNAQLELQTLDSFQNRSQNGANSFLKIVQEYIEKQKQQDYWKHLESQFLRVTDSPSSLSIKASVFLKQTLPQFEQQLKILLPELQMDSRTKETLSMQLKFKLLKHILYDVVKLNLLEQVQLPVSMNVRELRRERLKELIEDEKWLEKDQINGIAEQLKLLKKDFYNYCFQ